MAACCAALFALAAPEALASSLIVTNCSDSSGGSLRTAVALASSGDTIDMTGLSCSKITLTTGAVVVGQANLTLLGPGESQLQIQGGAYPATRNDTVIDHEGGGSLSVKDLELTGGFGHYAAMSVRGGCLYSNGNVTLSGVLVDRCNADAFVNGPTNYAVGGGIFTAGKLILINSTIRSNYVGADPAATVNSAGGGAWVGGAFVAKYSTISGNSAGYGTVLGQAGGLSLYGSVSISNSTIDYNHANYAAGGIFISFGSSGATITNSTISGNSAPKWGGLYAAVSTTINNSTIAFNQKSAVTGDSAGATFRADFASITVNLHSTLIANNTYLKSGVTTNNDIAVAPSPFTVTFSTDAQQGNFNLIRALDASVSAGSLPQDTIIGTCPLLGPLKNNGGPTRTIALYSGSPAIDAGVNGSGLQYDQRGAPFDRHSGLRTDIGAYEVQQVDVIFNSGFEGCP